jgi:hypothetical protein
VLPKGEGRGEICFVNEEILEVTYNSLNSDLGIKRHASSVFMSTSTGVIRLLGENIQ